MKVALMALLIPILIGVAVLALIGYGVWYIYVLKFRTVRATPNQVLMITGKDLGNEIDPTIEKNEKGNYVKILRGGMHRLRVQQFADKIDLTSFQIELKAEGVLVKGDDSVDAYASANIGIGDTNSHIINYAEQFMKKDRDDIIRELRVMLNAHFRSVLTTMTVSEINADRAGFNEKVTIIAKEDLDKWGFKLNGAIGLGVLEDSDENGYLSNTERKRKASMIREAEIKESEERTLTRIQLADDEQRAKALENEKAIENATSDKERVLEESRIKQETDKAKAEAEIAYELEKTKREREVVQEQNEIEKLKRQGIRELSLVEAQETRELAEKHAEKRIIEEENNKQTEEIRIKAQAERDKVAVESKAHMDKTKAEAEAEVAKTKAQADAEKERLANEVEADKIAKIGQAEAETTKLRGQAEAEALLAKAEAEEAMANARLKTQELTLQELALKQAPEVAKAVAQAIGSIKEVTVYASNGADVTGSVTDSVLSNVALVHDVMKKTTGVDLAQIAVNQSNQPKIEVNTKE